jgi:hypothetical protein
MNELAKKVKFICVYCGSTDVSCDATVRWDIGTQQWEIAGVQDQEYCEDCGGETSLAKVEL